MTLFWAIDCVSLMQTFQHNTTQSSIPRAGNVFVRPLHTGHLQWIWHRHLCHRFFFFFHKHTGEKCACDLLSSRGTRCLHCPGYTQTFTVKLQELETHCEKQFFKYDGHLSFKRYEAFTCKWSLLTCIQTISLQNKYKLIVVLTNCACIKLWNISCTVYAMDMNDSLINLLGDQTFRVENEPSKD